MTRSHITRGQVIWQEYVRLNCSNSYQNKKSGAFGATFHVKGNNDKGKYKKNELVKVP